VYVVNGPLSRKVVAIRGATASTTYWFEIGDTRAIVGYAGYQQTPGGAYRMYVTPGIDEMLSIEPLSAG
jgi:hypothetical protein